jgi:NAD+ diphosphatase
MVRDPAFLTIGPILHNRLSFLRTDKEYLQESLKAPSTRFLLLADHGVMFKSSTKHLAYASYEDIQSLIGADPLNHLPEGLVLIFLGADESGADQPQQENEVLVGGRRGTPYWALDMSAKGSGPTQELKDAIETFINSLTEKHGHYFAEMRPAVFSLNFVESGLVAQARALADWNRRNRFCAGCGQKNLSLEGGHKRACPPTILQDGQEVPTNCLAHKGVQNFTYPRTGKWHTPNTWDSSHGEVPGRMASFLMFGILKLFSCRSCGHCLCDIG